MKKTLSILFICFCFSATAQDYNNWIYLNGNIEIEDFNYIPPITDNNMSVVFPALSFSDYLGAQIQAYVNGNPISMGIYSDYGPNISEDGSGGVAVIGTDYLCGCDLADPGEEIQFAILIDGETIVNFEVEGPPITYTSQSFGVWNTYNFTVEGNPVEFGCTDYNFIEYSPSANIDDGSCSILKIFGCTDIISCVYNPDANFDDGSCIYETPESIFNSCCLDNLVTSICPFEGCATIDIDCDRPGCMSEWADNFDIFATLHDSSCYKMGCTSEWADNFDIFATLHDSSCYKMGCTSEWADNYDAISTTDDGSCDRLGCVSGWADNYDALATTDDGSCYRVGCVSDWADNYDEYATIDNDNCDFDIITHLNMSFDAWNISIDLSAGWNMFGYGCPTSIDVAQGLSNHTESIIITKDNNGNVYMPEFGFNGIGNFTPGFGYQIKLTESIEGFSLCDWYVNDIPEDNIVSLQEENISLSEQNTSLQEELDSIYGCIDETACNYDSQASLDDGSCFNNDLGCGCNLPAAFDGFDCDGNEINQETCPYDSYFEYNPISNNYNIDSCITLIIEGCTDLLAENFNINANLEDGSCEYINGCNISIASNFNPLVTQNDGSCEGCTDSSAANFSSQIMIDDGSCYYHGCMNPTSENYNPIAVADDGSCIIYGCILEDFPNYNSAATIDNGSCDMNSIQVFGCTNNQFLEYNYLANIDNGTCVELVPYIGEYRESLGGVVFHIDESGYSGLVAHQTNIGSANLTLAIELCNDFVVLGYDDWYLPSSEEQGIMLDNIAYDYDEENINNFPGGWYWNTSYNQYGAAQPRWLGPNCVSCTWGADNPSNSYHVRPIRAF